MASNIPEQIRAVDPFASYNSDTVNQLTRMATNGTNALKSYPGINVVEDSTSSTTQVVVTPGTIYMEDVLISVISRHTVDFTDPTQYVAFGTGFDEDGWYYIVFDYNYVKSRPAPEARIKILKPSQWNHPSLGTTLHFLKAIKVIGGGPHYIDTSTNFQDFDPSHRENKREYTDLYFGVETDLPTFNAARDRGRAVYESTSDTFWFGYDDRWSKITAGVEIAIDTTGVEVGAICYTDSDGNAEYAQATDVATAGEMIVAEVGKATTGQGRALMSGFASGALVETGAAIDVGDLLYLSTTEPGRLTNGRTQPFRQIVGRSLSISNSGSPIDILFFPRDLQIGTVEMQIQAGDWQGPTDGLYWDDLDISLLDATSAVIVSVFDGATNFKIYEADSELRSGGDVLRIYTPDPTVTWNIIVSAGGGGAGSGGGGGSTYHNSLFNLSYDVSGHDLDGSFAAGAGALSGGHGNADHINPFAEIADITYGNLNDNGSVGTGALQVARGNHTHTALIDVPFGEIILFESNVVVTGYTLQVDEDDMMVYITKGSGAGGETGGTTKAGSTWSQPVHNHTTGNHSLTIAEMPAHSHTTTTRILGAGGSYISNAQGPTVISSTAPGVNSTGGNGSHNHGSTGNSATATSWRPAGRNFTRQQRN